MDASVFLQLRITKRKKRFGNLWGKQPGLGNLWGARNRPEPLGNVWGPSWGQKTKAAACKVARSARCFSLYVKSQFPIWVKIPCGPCDHAERFTLVAFR